jgi:F0F1-type ATP synthase membrane subunit b/b'
MSEDRTKELSDRRPLEERVDRMEIRITNLEDRQYDTKPIWERVLAEIAELRSEVQGLRTDLRSEFQTGNEALRTDLRSEFQTGIESLRVEMKQEFAAVRHELDHGLRGMARTIDTLNHNVLEMQTYQRYVDKRLDILETELK